MKFVADECIGSQMISLLRQAGHEVISIHELAPSIKDRSVLAFANELGLPLVTEDNDFGMLVFVEHMRAVGVILLRLEGVPRRQRAQRLIEVLANYGDRIYGHMVSVDADSVRARPLVDPIQF